MARHWGYAALANTNGGRNFSGKTQTVATGRRGSHQRRNRITHGVRSIILFLLLQAI